MQLHLDQYSPASEPIWHSNFVGLEFSYLKDHRVYGYNVLPGAVYVVLGLALCKINHEKMSTFVLENLRFHQPLVITPGTNPILRLAYDRSHSEYSIYSGRENGTSSESLNATGKLVRDVTLQSRRVDIGEVRDRCRIRLESRQVYSMLKRCKLQYGPCFQRIRCVWRRPGEIFAVLEKHAPLDSEDINLLHPTILDACFQSLIAALDDTETEQSLTPYLPVRIKRVAYHHVNRSEKFFCHGVLTNKNKRMIVGDITLFDESGVVLAEIEGLQCLRGRKSPDLMFSEKH